MTRKASRYWTAAVVLALIVAAAEAQAKTRKSCHRSCKRFTRQCAVATSPARRCQRLLRRLDKCADVACPATTTTTTSSTTTTTVAGSDGLITVDEARAVSMTIPLQGGTLTTTGADGTVYSLTIPRDALLSATTITMAPIVAIAGEALPVLGVDLQPSGLRLYQFAELTITPPRPAGDAAGFSYEDDGVDLHAYRAVMDAGRIVLHVIHFSGAGAKICVELCPPPIVPPPPAVTESQLEQLIAALDPHHPFYASRLAELLHAYYDFFIAPDLALMQQDCEFAAGRIPKVLAWSRTNQLLLNEEGFEGKNQTVGNALVGSVSNCWSEATESCLNPNDAYQVQNLLQIARQAQLLGGDPEAFDLSTVRHCSGLWSGTITYEWTLDADAVSGADTLRNRQRTKEQWQIVPEVIGAPCEGCQGRMYRAIWSASGSIDNLLVSESPVCTVTVTSEAQVEGGAPAAFYIIVSRDRSRFDLQREWSESRGAPPWGMLRQPYVTKRINCRGYEETSDATLWVEESFGRWPFYDGLPLGRTDPTIPTTSEGQKADRQERQLPGGVEVITETWTWKLTLEPDAAQ
jgi:hypothetical protein